MHQTPRLLRLLGFFVSIAFPLAAQCANTWLPALSVTPSGSVLASVVWDPDGPGPQPEGVVVGGDFQSVGGQTLWKVALYHPETDAWTALPGLSMTGSVRALCVLQDGSLIAGGTFSGSATALARWNGSTWSTFAGGVNMPMVGSLLVEPNGDLIVGGTFTAAGGVPAIGVARWDGVVWSPLPGLQWVNPFGVGIAALARTSNGDLYAAGFLGLPNGWNVARWDGTSWTALWTGASATLATSLLALPNDQVMVGMVSGIYLWDGTALQQLIGSYGAAKCMRQLPDGDVLVAGEFTQLNFQPVGYLARWDGVTWSEVAGGANSWLHTMAPLANGDQLVAGGSMQILSTTCPATVVSYGTGCTGSGGLNELSAATPPWIGSQFEAQATGMPAIALVLSVYGFAQLSIPFPAVIPEALPGCTVWTSGDHIDLLLPSAGAVHTTLALPDAASIVGVEYHHYVVPLEVDSAGNLLAVTNSNALTCTVGAF